MIQVNECFRYSLHDEVAIENFSDGCLIFLAKQNRIIEINHSARWILSLLNGEKNLSQVIETITRKYFVNETDIRSDIQKLITDLGYQGVVIPMVKVIPVRRNRMGKSEFLLAKNEISLREEDDGAILFDAVTDALNVINPVGLLIWKFIQFHPRTRKDIVGHLIEHCEDVPTDQIEHDVDQFVTELQLKGFIVEVIDEKR